MSRTEPAEPCDTEYDVTRNVTFRDATVKYSQVSCGSGRVGARTQRIMAPTTKT